MGKHRMKFRNALHSVGMRQYLSVLAILVSMMGGYLILGPKTRDVTVVVRLADKDARWLDNGSPRGVSAYDIQPGMKETDVFGRVASEVLRVTSFDQPVRESQYTPKKTVYVTLRLRAAYNGKTDQYRYQGTILQSGDWARFTVRSFIISGIITQIPVHAVQPPVPIVMKMQLKTEGQFNSDQFHETTGVDRYIADAITVGDRVVDSEGTILAEVLEKNVTRASRITFDQYGGVHVQEDPRKYDIFLTVRVFAQQLGTEFYYLDSVRLKVNATVPIFLPHIDIEPRITEIMSVGK